MKANEPVHFENMNLLMEIVSLKTKINELYTKEGPGSSDYIILSLKLKSLIDEYIEEKIVHLM